MDRFKENFPDFPDGEITHDNKPDFLVTTPDGVLGIEVTEFYRERASPGLFPLQKRERTRQKIIERAKSIFDLSGLPPMTVSVHFEFRFCCRTSEIEPIAEKLVELAKRALSEPDRQRVWRREEIQIEGVHSLSIEAPLMSRSYWRAPLASFVPEVKASQIQEILDDKNSRCDSYRARCDRVWLVIFMDRFRASSFSLIPEGIGEQGFTHKFDTAFLFFYDYSNCQKPPIILRNKQGD